MIADRQSHDGYNGRRDSGAGGAGRFFRGVEKSAERRILSILYGRDEEVLSYGAFCMKCGRNAGDQGSH